MYSLINQNCKYIIKENPQKLVKHFKDYLYLLDKNNWQNECYKGKFKTFWGMNAARKLSSNTDFYSIYFNYFMSKPSIPDVNVLLDEIRKTNAGFQFSFATKAVHILNPDLPIYDANVRRFYFLKDIDNLLTWEQKQVITKKYYEFLQEEYKRITTEKLLASTVNEIDIFLKTYKIDPQNLITQTKKIDSIIWSWVDYLNKRQLSTSQVIWR